VADQRHDSVGPGHGAGPDAEASFPGRLERFLSECAQTIAGFAGDDGVRAVYLCGSFAAGEGSVAFDGGAPLFLSDIDLVLVVDSIDAHRALYPRRREISAACEARWPEARFAGHVDVGVLLSSELGGLDPSPGVFDMRRTGRVLSGDPSVIGLLPEADTAVLGPPEARLLCENRIASLLGTVDLLHEMGSDALAILRYAVSRVYTDILTAELCATRAYRPGYAERVRWLREDPTALRLRESLGPGLVDRIDTWTAYKLRPSPELAPRGGPEELWLEAAAQILLAWKRSAAASAGLDPAASLSRPVEELIAMSTRGGRAVPSLLRWKEYLRRHRGLSLPGAVVLAIGRFRNGTPDDQVRGEGIRLVDAALMKGIDHETVCPAGGFPHHGGSFRSAARVTSSVWRALVYGKES